MEVLRVQLFVLQMVLQKRFFRVQLFVLQSVLQMGVFACNFLCSKSCSRRVFSRGTFCAPNRAPDWSFRVQLFVVQQTEKIMWK